MSRNIFLLLFGFITSSLLVLGFTHTAFAVVDCDGEVCLDAGSDITTSLVGSTAEVRMNNGFIYPAAMEACVEWRQVLGPSVSWPDGTRGVARPRIRFTQGGNYEFEMRIVGSNCLVPANVSDRVAVFMSSQGSITVNAGPDFTVIRPNVAQLRGITTPVDVPAGSVWWQKKSGPGTVTFGGTTSGDSIDRNKNTTAGFAVIGTYVLQFCSLFQCDDVTVTVRDRVSTSGASIEPAGGIKSAGGKYEWGGCTGGNAASYDLSPRQKELLLTIESGNPIWVRCLNNNGIQLHKVNFTERLSQVRGLPVSPDENPYVYLGIPTEQKDYIPASRLNNWMPLTVLQNLPGAIPAGYSDREPDFDLHGYALGWWGLSPGRNPDGSLVGFHPSGTDKCVPDWRGWKPFDKVPAFTGGPTPNGWANPNSRGSHPDPRADEVVCGSVDPFPGNNFARGDNVVVTGELNVRQGPGTAFPVIGTAVAGDRANIQGGPIEAGGFKWYLVSFFDKDLEGYVSDHKLVLERNYTPPPGGGGGGQCVLDPRSSPPQELFGNTRFSNGDIVIALTDRNIRSGAGTNQSFLGSFSRGQVATIIGAEVKIIENGIKYQWFKMRFSTGLEGWVAVSRSREPAVTQYVALRSLACPGGGGPSPSPSPSGPQNPSGIVAGDRVRIIASNGRQVRSSAAGPQVGSQAFGAQGTVVSGPERQAISGVLLDWFNINFDSGADGWVGSFQVGGIGRIDARFIEKITGGSTGGTASCTIEGSQNATLFKPLGTPFSISWQSQNAASIQSSGWIGQIHCSGTTCQATTLDGSGTWPNLSLQNQTQPVSISLLPRNAGGTIGSACTATIIPQNIITNPPVPPPGAICLNNWNNVNGGLWDGDGAGSICGCNFFGANGQEIVGPVASQCRPAGGSNPPPPPPSPVPSGLAAICPDGLIDGTSSEGFIKEHIQIPAGVVKQYCALVQPPNVPAGVHPQRISFQYYDESDRDCGALALQVKQIGGAGITKSSIPLANGGLQFTTSITPTQFHHPEESAQGIYQITATGHPTHCSQYYIGWGVEGDVSGLITPALGVGARAKVSDTPGGSSLNVRATANGTSLGTQPNGAQGVIVGGPVTAGGYKWWQMNFDSGPDGWVAWRYIRYVSGGTTAQSLPQQSETTDTEGLANTLEGIKSFLEGLKSSLQEN